MRPAACSFALVAPGGSIYFIPQNFYSGAEVTATHVAHSIEAMRVPDTQRAPRAPALSQSSGTIPPKRSWSSGWFRSDLWSVLLRWVFLMGMLSMSQSRLQTSSFLALKWCKLWVVDGPIQFQLLHSSQFLFRSGRVWDILSPQSFSLGWTLRGTFRADGAHLKSVKIT